MTDTIDLWGDITTKPMRLPLHILREQASLLEEKTEGLLKGSIRSQNFREDKLMALAAIMDKKTPRSSYLKYTFFIEAPSLTYSYQLFSFYQPIEVFPVTFDISELENEEENIIAKDEKEFIEILRSILQSPKTEKIISSLLAQSLALA